MFTRGDGSAVEGQALAQHLVGDLAVLPGDLAVDQGHFRSSRSGSGCPSQRLKVSRLPSTLSVT